MSATLRLPSRRNQSTITLNFFATRTIRRRQGTRFTGKFNNGSLYRYVSNKDRRANIRQSTRLRQSTPTNANLLYGLHDLIRYNLFTTGSRLTQTVMITSLRATRHKYLLATFYGKSPIRIRRYNRTTISTTNHINRNFTSMNYRLGNLLNNRCANNFRHKVFTRERANRVDKLSPLLNRGNKCTTNGNRRTKLNMFNLVRGTIQIIRTSTIRVGQGIYDIRHNARDKEYFMGFFTRTKILNALTNVRGNGLR